MKQFDDLLNNRNNNPQKDSQQIQSIAENEKQKSYKDRRDEANLKNIEQDRELRKEYSTKLFYFIVAYTSIVLIIVITCGFGIFYKLNFHLDNSILITLLTTTLTTIIGLFIIVVKYLFPNK